MKEIDVVINDIELNIKGKESFINQYKNCPYCKELLKPESKTQPYILHCDNIDCSYTKGQKGFGFITNLGKEIKETTNLKYELSILKILESLRIMRNAHPVHYDSLVTTEFLIAYDLVKEQSEKIITKYG